jgi:hypothetical protein
LWTTMGFLAYFGIGGGLFRNIEINFAASYSSFESNFAFVFALLMPIAVIRRQWLHFIFLTAMAVICFKRIALLGSLVVCVMCLIPPRFGEKLVNRWTMVAMNVLVLALTIGYALGSFDYLISHYTGQSANQLGQGRRALQMEAARQIVADPQYFAFFGQGAGKAYQVAEVSSSQFSKANMHSDILKIVYELGFVFFIVYFYLLYSARNYYERLIYLYYNYLMFTDNALIYYGFLFFLTVVVRTLCVPPEPAQKVRIELQNARAW